MSSVCCVLSSMGCEGNECVKSTCRPIGLTLVSLLASTDLISLVLCCVVLCAWFERDDLSEVAVSFFLFSVEMMMIHMMWMLKFWFV